MKNKHGKERGLYLDPDYTFDTFIAVKSNRAAYEAAKAAARNLSETANPLLICGNTGMGKTHLLQAIGYQYDKSPLTDVCYISAETFFSGFIAAIQNRQIDECRCLYQTFDLLLIDDIDWLEGKIRLTSEFADMLEYLFQQKTTVVMTATTTDWLRPNLISKFPHNQIVQIEPLSHKECIQIIRAKASTMTLQLSPETANRIAKQAEGDIRKIEGQLAQIVFAKT